MKPSSDIHLFTTTLPPPVLESLIPFLTATAYADAHRRRQRATAFFAEAFGGQAFDEGTAYGLEDCLAVALWMRPGVGPDEEGVMGVMGESLDDQILEDVNGLFERMVELHPTGEVWYLPLIGVDL